MAVSNSIGSNIFDVLLGLGFPWALRTLIVSYGSVVTTVFSTQCFIQFIRCILLVLWFDRELLPHALPLIYAYINNDINRTSKIPLYSKQADITSKWSI